MRPNRTHAAVEARPSASLARRAFLTQLGRTAAGLVVVGPVAAACSSDDPVVDVPQTTPSAATSAEPATSTEAATSASSEAAADAAPAGPADIRQVDLGFVSAFVLVRGGEAMIVDTGVEGSASAIEAVLTEAGVGWGAVGHLVMTHKHADHVGSLGAVAELAAAAQIYAGEADIPAITAPRTIQAVADGEQVFGARVVATPGHTPGHISLFDTGTGALFAGDAIVNDPSGLMGPNAAFSEDIAIANSSVGVLAELFPEAIYFGHGPVLASGAAGPLSDLAATL